MNKSRLLSLALACLMTLSLITGCAQSKGAATDLADATAPKAADASTAASSAVASEVLEATQSGTNAVADATAAGIRLTDMKGREISLDAPAGRIVALTASDCEILYAIGAGDTLVGRGEYCDYPAEVSSIPSVQSGAETNIEQIIGLKPQVVIMSTMTQTVEQVDALENAGITVVVSEAKDIAGVYTAINMIGAITGKVSDAKSLVDQMKSVFSEISAKVPANTGKTVYFEVSPLEYGLWTAGSGTFLNELAGMLGLKNAFADLDGWAEISQEQVIKRNPDYIVTITMYSGSGVLPVDEIKARDGWQNISAVKNNAILNADSNSISRPGPRLADALKTMYSFIYGNA